MNRASIWISALIFFQVIVTLRSIETWSIKQLFPSQLIPADGLSPKRSVVRRKIVIYHNLFRSKVKPSASNMLLMSWHDEAARQAQAYADKCIYLKHNDIHENVVPRLGICGQNLFVASQKTPWFFAIKTWFLEYRNFTYGVPVKDLKAVGHYTQMVWATTHKVGCGVAKCLGGPWGTFWNYVCHYCPGGNIETITHFPYKPGAPCSSCQESCISGSLCTNSCSERDLFSNCNDLVSLPGFCSYGTCNATCTCGNSHTYKNYPWI